MPSLSTLPRTLLDIAGTRLRSATLENGVLVIVDAQMEYVDGQIPLPGIDAAIGEAARLLCAARAAGTPIIHIVQHSAAGRPVFDPSTRFAEIVPQLTPLPGEEVIAKRLPNAFAGTSLEAHVKTIFAGTGRSTMILAGFMTHMCISATARASLDLGIPTTIVASATATRDIPDPLGGTIPAATVHRTALAEIADRFASVVGSVEQVTHLQRQQAG